MSRISAMTLANGMRVDPWDLRPEDIEITSIAHSLSLLCRFGGHISGFYSVAQHSVRVADLVDPQFRLEALMHDATEAFLQDLIRPIKKHLPAYQEVEDLLWKKIAFKYGFPMTLSPQVKEADNAVLKSEIRQLVAPPGRDLELANPYWNDFEEPPGVEFLWSPEHARSEFMHHYVNALVDRVKFIQSGVIQCQKCQSSSLGCGPDCPYKEIMHKVAH